MRKNVIAGILGLMVACAWSPSQALKVTKEGSPDTWFNLRMLMQPYLQTTFTMGADKAAEPTPDLGWDVFLRRTRLIMAASVNKHVGFFFETEASGLGAGRAFGRTFWVQDAIVQLKFSKAFNLNIGKFLPGFSRDFFTSAAALHGIDYHGAGTGLAYPQLASGTDVWRDSGIQAIGWLMGDKLEYRFSIGTGVAGPADETPLPRITGRISYNVWDPEAKLFPAATYLGAKKVLSIGAAFDMQPKAINGEDMYLGLTGDVYLDMPMAGDRRLTGAAGFLFYKLGDANQLGAFFDAGMAFGKWEPMISVHWNKPDGADFDASHFDIHAALMHWTYGHNFNVKFDVGLIKGNGVKFFDDGQRIVATVRTQLLF